MCVQRLQESVSYPPLEFATYFFEAGSLPDPGALVFSVRLEASKPHLLSSPPREQGLQVCTSYYAYYVVLVSKFGPHDCTISTLHH